MVTQADVNYATAGDFKIAYQVVGTGPIDLVVAPGFVSHLDIHWNDPDWVRAIGQLGSFARLILFDKRGTGLSDPTSVVPTLEERVEDVRAVMDAAGSERAALFGFSEGAAMSLMFAATEPERVTALILFGALVSGAPDADSAARWSHELATTYQAFDELVEHWGEGNLLAFMAPSIRQGEMGRRITSIFERTSASPAMARALVEGMKQLNLGEILGSITQPTLVLHRTGDAIPVGPARDLATRIPNAKFVELEGPDHWWWIGNVDEIVGQIEEFLTGTRHRGVPDRALATVMFTDIVGSTETAVRLGDRAWREVLERYDSIVRDQAKRYRGSVIKSTGDGFLLTFPGPARAVECAASANRAAGELGLNITTGIHTGECEFMSDGDIGGIAVHIAARVAAMAGAGEILVSSTVKDLVVGSGLSFTHRGSHRLKGVPDEWDLYAADEGSHDPTAPKIEPDTSDGLAVWQRTLWGVGKRSPALGRAVVALSRRSKS